MLGAPHVALWSGQRGRGRDCRPGTRPAGSLGLLICEEVSAVLRVAEHSVPGSG